MIKKILLSLVVLFLFSCGGAGDDNNYTKLTDKTELSSTVSFRTQIFKDKTSLETEWQNFKAGNSTAPEIDFNTKMVVGLFNIMLPTSCYSLTITSVTNTGEDTTIFYKIKSPSSNESCTSAVAYYSILISVPLHAGNIYATELP